MSKLPIILTATAAVVGAIILILGGVLGWVVIPDIIDHRIEDEVRIHEDSDTYKKWKDIPVPVFSKFYFFHVTNYEDFAGKYANLSKIPQFVEVGPYAFREIRNKSDIRLGADDTIYYKQNTMYIFDEEASGEGLKANDKVTILSMPYITTVTLQDIYPQTALFSQTVLDSLLLANETLFMKDVPVDEVLFKNYELPGIYKQVEQLGKDLFHIQMPDEIQNGMYAFFRGKNNTDDGQWQVYRGNKDKSKFNTIKTIRGKGDLGDWWKGKCNGINGTDGTMFPPFITEDRRLDIYVPEICRSIHMTYDSKVKYEGIQGYRFRLPDSIFDPENKENECFCSKMREPLESTCDQKGIWKIFSCKAQAPIVISKPHYLDADEDIKMTGQRSGLRPVTEDHDSYIDVEPYTGFPLRVHVRLQIGAEIQSYKYLPNRAPFNTIPHVYYPALWVDKSAELDGPSIDELKEKLVKPMNIVKAVKWTMIGVGAFLVVSGAIGGFYFLRK